jgi:hypothetical protein
MAARGSRRELLQGQHLVPVDRLPGAFIIEEYQPGVRLKAQLFARQRHDPAAASADSEYAEQVRH